MVEQLFVRDPQPVDPGHARRQFLAPKGSVLSLAVDELAAARREIAAWKAAAYRWCVVAVLLGVMAMATALGWSWYARMH